MGFLAEMLAAAVVWLSSFALGQFGMAVETCVRPEAAQASAPKTVARSPRKDAATLLPIAAAPTVTPSGEA